MIDLRRIFGRPAPPPAGIFGFAVVGLGRIAEHFVNGIANSPTARATALVSGDAAKAKRLAAKHNVPHVCTYADFDSLRDRADVHAVYIALPVSMHAEFTARAAAAGKHVLVEKPMAPTAADCRSMIDSCRSAGVLLSVAYRCPYDLMHQQARQLLQSGMLGTLERMDSNFGFVLAADDWRNTPGLAGGGSLYDVGIYCLNAARYFTGAEPTTETARATTSPAALETSIDWTSTFPQQSRSGQAGIAQKPVIGHFHSSYLERFHGQFSLHGTLGSLTLSPAFAHREPIRLRGTINNPGGGSPTHIAEQTPKDAPSHFRLEAEALADCARTGKPLPTPGEDGLRDLEAMERIYAAAGL